LKILTKEVIGLLDEKKIEPIAYGSLVLFGYVKDSSLNVNDLDLLVKEPEMNSVLEILKESGIKYEYLEDHHTIHIEENNVRIEIDSKEFGFDNEEFTYENFNFGGLVLKCLSLESLNKVYLIASQKSSERAEEYKIKHTILEKLTRKVD
jgi:hypothetical protein